MDISCIISSGDLELYVLGMLSEEDNLKVAQIAQLFPEIKTEIEGIENSLLQVSDETDVPSDSVKDNLFAKLKNLPLSEAPADSYVSGDLSKTIETRNEYSAISKNEAAILTMPKPAKRRSNSGLLAASIIALIACVGVVIYLAVSNNNYRSTASQLNARVDKLETDRTKQLQQVTDYQHSLALYQNPSYQKINLTSVPGKPKAAVEIFWNKATQDVYAANISLPAAPSGKQYQLWALINGKPVNAGMITGNTLPQKMIAFAKADAFAITLEKEGGSLTPTLSEMYVLGKTS